MDFSSSLILSLLQFYNDPFLFYNMLVLMIL